MFVLFCFDNWGHNHDQQDNIKHVFDPKKNSKGLRIRKAKTKAKAKNKKQDKSPSSPHNDKHNFVYLCLVG